MDSDEKKEQVEDKKEVENSDTTAQQVTKSYQFDDSMIGKWAQCENYRILLSRFFNKNYVKTSLKYEKDRENQTQEPS